MAEVIVDLTNYRDRHGNRVAEGIHHVTVEDAELDKSKAGNPMITMYLRVIGGENDGATLVDRLTQTEAALFRTVAFMQAIGMPTPKKKMRINLDKFIGKHLEVRVEDGDPYNGVVKSEIREYIRLSKNTEEEADLSDLDDEETEKVAKSKKKKKKKAKETEVDAGDEPEEIDLDSLDLG